MLHKSNWRGSWILIFIGLILAAGVTLAGLYNRPKVAAILGILITLLISLQQAFPLSEKAEFDRIVVAESRKLLDDVVLRIRTEAEFQKVLSDFQVLADYAARSVPKGHGMEVVKNMGQELGSTP